MRPAKLATVTLSELEGSRVATVPGTRVQLVCPGQAPLAAQLSLTPISVGTGEGCTLLAVDPSVSRRHCELSFAEDGVALLDLGSKNGTFVGGARVREAVLGLETLVQIGDSQLTLVAAGESEVAPLSTRSEFGGALGGGLKMRALFARLERAAATDHPVLLVGESGTGKGVLARALHDESSRSAGPFVVLDCAAVSPTLLEAQLFGYVRGAFSGADQDRPGVLSEAEGGTLFIDEIAALGLDLQSRLLRALDTHQVQALGSTELRSVDFRVVAASQVNLRQLVHQKRFREDLYFRLAVVECFVPPLRQRKEDLPALVDHFLALCDPPGSRSDLPSGVLELLSAHRWPGNLRELRNVISRLVLFPEAGYAALRPERLAGRDDVGRRGFHEAREVALVEFERKYLLMALEEHRWNVSAAAEAIGVSRQFVHRLIQRHALRRPE